MALAIDLDRLRMAIYAYDKLQDLWGIPLKLMEMLPKFRLHMRHHGVNGFVTVAYAIPYTGSGNASTSHGIFG